MTRILVEQWDSTAGGDPGRSSSRSFPLVRAAGLATVSVLACWYAFGVAGVSVFSGAALGTALTFSAVDNARIRKVAGAVLAGTAVALWCFSMANNPWRGVWVGARDPVHARLHLTEDLRLGVGDWARVDAWLVSVTTREGVKSEARGQVELWWRREQIDLQRRLWAGQIVETTVSEVRVDNHARVRLFVNGTDLRVHSPEPRLRAGIWRRARTQLIRANEDVRALVMALTLADKTDLDPRLAAAFRLAGASHALALSGMHLAILAGLCGMVVQPVLGPRRTRRVVLPVLLLYVTAVGTLASLVRAVVGAVWLWWTGEHDVRAHPVDTLIGTTLTVLVLFPQMASDVGLWLSVAALGALVTLGPRAVDALSRCLPRAPAAAVGASWAAFVGTAPISWAVFGTLYPAGIVGAAPLGVGITLYAWTALATFALAGVPWIGLFLVRALALQYNALLWVATAVARCNTPSIALPLVLVPAAVVWYDSLRARMASKGRS